MKLGNYYRERGVVGKCVGIKQKESKSCLEFDRPVYNGFYLLPPGIDPKVEFSEFIPYNENKYHLWCWDKDLKPVLLTIMETE